MLIFKYQIGFYLGHPALNIRPPGIRGTIGISLTLAVAQLAIGPKVLPSTIDLLASEQCAIATDKIIHHIQRGMVHAQVQER
jgi:hypothetical protein